MSNLTIGYAGIAAAVLLMLVRVPVAVALGGTSIVGIWTMRGSRPAMSFLGNDPYELSASWILSAIPMFLLLGSVAFNSGLTANIYRAARMWLSAVPGGVAVATNWACAVFGAVSGSSLATTAAIGKLAIPEMLRYGYHPGLAAGTVAAAGTLGALIPPSVAFVIFGFYAEAPVGKLLIAGILPGILTATIYSGMVVLRCMRNPALAPPPTEQVTWRDRFLVLLDIWPIPVIMVGIVGTMYGGVATSTEAAALGALSAVLVAVARRKLTIAAFVRSIVDAGRTTGALFFIVIAAALFTKFLALSGVPPNLAGTIRTAGLDPISFILAVTAVYLVLGCFLDGIGVMLLTLPILVPICRQLNIDLIWMGVMVVKLIEIGTITPPVGMHAFMVKSIAGDRIALGTIFGGISWFLAAEVVIMALLIAFPVISLLLPGMMN